MQETAPRRLGIDERGFDPVAEFLLAPGQGADPALARRPVAGRHVEQGLLEAMTVQLLGDHLGRMVVRGEILDRLEAAPGGCGEALEKSDFLEYEAEVGGEFRHGEAPLWLDESPLLSRHGRINAISRGASTRRRKRRRSAPSAGAAHPAGLLAPVLDEGAQSRLGQQAPSRNPAGVPRRDGMRLVRGQDAPVKAVCSARTGVSDDPARLAFGIDEQLGARADATPLGCRIRRTALPAA